MTKQHQNRFNTIWKTLFTFILLISIAVPSHKAGAIDIPTPIIVSTTAVPGNPLGPCDLGGALQAAFNANSNDAPSTVDTCTANPGPIVIAFNPLLTGQTIHLNGTDLPWIHDNTTIEGVGITIDGGGSGQDVHVFRLAPGASFNLVGMIITNAYTTGNGPAIFDNNQGSINLVGVNLIDNHAGNGGGAIESNGNLNIITSNLMANKASGTAPGTGYGGAISFSGGGSLSISKSNFTGNMASGDGGGAIWIQSTYNTTSDIADTLFTGDVASTGGGAIYNASTSSDAMLKIERTAFSANLATSGSGGAIWNGINAKTDISDSSFNLNVAGTPVSAQMGGAIYNQSPDLTITRAAFIGNSSPGGDGGALADDRGGAIAVSNSSFSGNLASGKGGAIMATNTQAGSPQSTVTALNDTIAGNSIVPEKAGSGAGIFAEAGHEVDLGNTILDSNPAENCAGPGIFATLGHNLSSDLTCNLDITKGDLPGNANAGLSKPGFNGGPFASQLSMMLASDSSAIDRGDNAICAAAPVSNQDQRGNSRPTDGDGNSIKTCDIGSYEADAAVSGYGSSPVQPGPINLGNTTINNLISNAFQVFDTGAADLQITGSSIAGANAADFGIVSLPSVISKSDGNKDVTLSCVSATQGAKGAILTLTTNDPAYPSVNYNVYCNVGPSPAAGYGSSPIWPGPIVLPATQTGTTTQTILTVKNTGTADLTVSTPLFFGANWNEFTTSTAFPFTIHAGGAPVNVVIKCTPADVGLRSAKLDLTSNDPNVGLVTYLLMCTGNPPPPPALVNVANLTPNIWLPQYFSSPFDAAISPDGQNAYVTYTDSNTGAGSIAILTHDPFIKKYLDEQFPNGFVTDPKLSGPTEIAVTPDGKFVFAVGSNSNSVVMFRCDPTDGSLSSPTTWTNGTASTVNMAFPYGIAISPDGNNVYVTAKNSHAVAIFDKFHNTYSFSMSVVDADLNQAAGLAISPDGTSLYVAASIDAAHGNLVMFHRNPADGSLTKLTPTRSQDDCIDYFFCPPGLDGMKGITKVAVSPDGSQVYAVSASSMAVLGFNRDPVTGYLHIHDSHFNTTPGVSGLSVVDGVSISPDGSQVYTAAYVDKAADVFDREPMTGQLSFDQKIQRNIGGVPPLDGARNVTVSPDGQIILVTASVDDALVELAYASPIATLTDLAPASALQAGADFTLTVHGKDFVNGAQVYWNGSNSGITTTFVNSATVTAAIPSAKIASAGSATVNVHNPGPGGGPANNTLTFTITAGLEDPVPSIDHLNPQGATAGQPAFNLDVFGANFASGAKVYWDGNQRSTTFVDGTHLIATVPLNDVAQPGLASVTVNNPAQAIDSNQVVFNIAAPGMNPVPSISCLIPEPQIACVSPAQVLSHGGASTPTGLTVNGFNFVDGSVIKWNGSTLPTLYISSTQLTTTIPASDLTASGSAVVSVFNPAPGGGESDSAPILIAAGSLPPLLNKVTAITATGGQVIITLSGSYFQTVSVGQVNGDNQTTTYIDANTLQISLPASAWALLLNTRLTVINPKPDYGLSNPVTITVNHAYMPVVKK